jgi:predicted nucleic acid-binding protein
VILVIDASVTIANIVDDERAAYAEAAFVACGHDRALVPGLWQWEVANVLMTLERKGRIADAEQVFTRTVRRLPIDVRVAPSAASVREEIALARRHELTIYDASYLALAKSEGVRLATLDERLARAARAEGAYFQAT